MPTSHDNRHHRAPRPAIVVSPVLGFPCHLAPALQSVLHARAPPFGMSPNAWAAPSKRFSSGDQSGGTLPSNCWRPRSAARQGPAHPHWIRPSDSDLASTRFSRGVDRCASKQDCFLVRFPETSPLFVHKCISSTTIHAWTYTPMQSDMLQAILPPHCPELAPDRVKYLFMPRAMREARSN